jgi:betaine-aldehyde dehydrogenase
MSTAVLENYINGELVASSASETLDLISPVDESVVGRAPIPNLADVVVIGIHHTTRPKD